jgi:multiple sugar transport system substrate-binding protein
MDSITKLRPFQLILMSVFGLFALIGLIVFATSKSLSGGASIGSVVIWGTLSSDAVSQELEVITAADKSYGKVTYVQEPAATFDTDLANAIASGNGPDLVLISQEQLLSEESKLTVIPFSSVPQKNFTNTYLPEDQLYLTTNGTYGIPYVVDPLVLYYNQTLLNQAGVAVPPASWEAVTGLAPTLTHLNGGVTAQSEIALGTYDNIENARGILSTLFFQAGSTITQMYTGGVRSTLASTDANNLTGISPVAAALNFYTQFADPTRTVYSWNSSVPSARQAFIGGTLAFYIGYASEAPALTAANPNLSFAMAPIPQPQTAAVKADYGLAYAFAVPKAARNASGAFYAAQKLSDPTYLASAAEALSLAPANRTILTPSPSDTNEAVYFPAALIASGWLSPSPTNTDAVFSAMITSIASGHFNAADAVNAADAALNAVLPTN